METKHHTMLLRAHPQLAAPLEQALDTPRTALAAVRAWTKASSGVPPKK